MKVVSVIAKILAALAAAIGAIYLLATYGEKIVAWCKKTMDAMIQVTYCDDDEEIEDDEDDEEVEVFEEVTVADDIDTVLDELVEDLEQTEEVVEEVAAEVVADDSDFEG